MQVRSGRRSGISAQSDYLAALHRQPVRAKFQADGETFPLVLLFFYDFGDFIGKTSRWP